MAIEPKTTREQIISLYGQVTGVKRDLYQIKNNHLKHMQRDIDRLNYILWAIGFMVATQFVSWILRMFG